MKYADGYDDEYDEGRQNFELPSNNSDFCLVAGLNVSLKIESDWTIIEWSERAEDIFNLRAQDVIGRDLRQVLPSASNSFYETVGDGLRSVGYWCNSAALINTEATVNQIIWQFVTTFDAQTQRKQICVSAMPQSQWLGTDRRMASLEAVNDIFDQLFFNHPDGVLFLDRNGNIVTANDAMAKFTGYLTEELSSLSLESLIASTSLRTIKNGLNGVWNGTPFTAEIVLLSNAGRLLDGALSVIPNYADNRINGAHVIIKDISDQKEDQRRILFLATHDVLTGLPNRRLLHTRMQHALENARRVHGKVGVLFMDLNRFKVINDSLGHDRGDELLCAVARRLSEAVREVDTVSRLGGDEFVVVLGIVDSADAIIHVAHTLAALVSQPVTVGSDTLQISTSIGAALFPDDGINANELLKNADLAMYEAKKSGAPFIRLYDPLMNAKAIARLSSENDLREAISAGELVIHYQPRLNLATDQIVALEALVRWAHPRRGLIHPAGFIGLAEETGLILELGEWVLNTAVGQMAAWQRAGMQSISISVNMSPLQIHAPDMVEMVARAIERSNFDARFLELEITENSLIGDIERSIMTLSRLRQLGVALSIDDFGTGYSSLSYLKRLPVSTLKIDKSFVRDVCEDSDDAAIVSATIAMAHKMDIDVVAEGVTTFDQLRFLEARGCDEIQGYLLCRPLPAEEIEIFCKTSQLRGVKYSWVH